MVDPDPRRHDTDFTTDGEKVLTTTLRLFRLALIRTDSGNKTRDQKDQENQDSGGYQENSVYSEQLKLHDLHEKKKKEGGVQVKK